MDETTRDLLKHAMTEYNPSARAYDRILKVARTIADLRGEEKRRERRGGRREGKGWTEKSSKAWLRISNGE